MKVASLLQSEIPEYTTVLPITGKEVCFRPYLVKEEKVLLLALQEGTERAILTGIKTLIQSCTKDVDDAGDLVMGDLEHLFLHLRGKSVGEVMEPHIICPFTEKQIATKIDINDIKLSGDAPSPKIKLDENVGITMTLPTINILQKTKVKKIADLEKDIDGFFSLIAYCITEIWTKEEVFPAKEISKNEIQEFIEAMTVEQFDKVLAFFKNAPKLQYKLKYKIPYSPEELEEKNPQILENTINLEGLSDFFG